MRRLTAIRAATLVIAVLLPASACASGNKAGGASAKHTIVLTFASQWQGIQPDQLLRFATEVAKLSHDTIRIQFKGNWEAGDRHQEVDTIRDVKTGKVDLAWVGARAWDWLGVRNFDPLVTPLLIDSYPLEARVFAHGMPQRMLAGVKRVGVVGIGVLPGPMRKVLGVDRALVGPADFRGLRFGLQGVVAAETLRALGAQPRQMFANESLTGLSGLEGQMLSIANNNYDTAGSYLDANLNLWPRPLVIFASPKVFGALNAAQQRVLRDAAAAAVPEALTASEQEDVDAVHTLCARGKVSLVDVNAHQLQSLERAVEPVYRRLRRNPDTRRAISQIEALRRAAPGPPPIRCKPAAASAGGAATPIDGTWQMTVTASQLRGNPAYKAYGSKYQPPNEYTADAGTYRFVFHDGHLESSMVGPDGTSHDEGTYRVRGDLVIFYVTAGHDVGETDAYRWNIYRDTLTFQRPQHGAQGPPNPTFAPWHRIAASRSGGPKSEGRTPLDGVYDADVSLADLVRINDATDGIPENLGHYVYVFDRGRFAFTQENAKACTWQYGKFNVHGKSMTWRFIDGGAPPGKAPDHAYNKRGEVFKFRWSLYRDDLTVSPGPGVSPGSQIAKPWHRLSSHPSRSYLSKDCQPPKSALP